MTKDDLIDGSDVLVGVGSSLARRHNTRLVLRTLRALGDQTLGQLVEQTRLSRSTVEDILGTLAGRGLVTEAPRTSGTQGRVGRPPRRYRFRQDGGYVAGVSIGLNRVVVQVADLMANVVAEHRVPVELDQIGPRPLPVIYDGLHTALDTAGLPVSMLQAVGVGVPGITDEAGSIVLCAPAPSWGGVPLAAQAERSLGCRVLVDNHGRLAAAGEKWKGVAQDEISFLFVLVGTRTGVGIFVNDQLLRGRHGAAGQLGDSSPLSWCRRPDVLRRLSSITSMPAGEEALTRVLASGEDRPPAMIEFADEYLHSLGIGIAQLVQAIDPDLVVVGGDLANVLAPHQATLERHIDERCLFPAQVRLSSLGQDSIVLGALKIAMDHAEEAIYSL